MKLRKITATECIEGREAAMKELDEIMQRPINSFWSWWYETVRQLLAGGPWGLAGVEPCPKCSALKFVGAECGKCAQPSGKVACPMSLGEHPAQCNLCKGSGYVDEL